MSTLGVVRAALARLAHLQPADADPIRTFLPALHHGRALHRNTVVVLGGRGSGKTALFRLVNDRHTSGKTRALWNTDLIPEAGWLDAFSTGSIAHPDVGVLGARARSASDLALRAFWMTHLLRRLHETVPDIGPTPEPVTELLRMPVADVTAWMPVAEARIGAVSAALDNAERALEGGSRTVVATYDNLDLIAPFVPAARRRFIAALLALWLTLDERYRRLRGKVFLRDDLLDAAELGFADASKLRSRAERLEWAPGDLYRVIVRHLVNGPDGALVREWLGGIRGVDLSDQGDLGWMVGPMAEAGQRAFAAKLAGRTIGRGVVKGSTHVWMVSRLSDARQTTTPRAMLSLVGFAAEKAERRGRSEDRGPVFGGAELLEALRLTSQDRVEEVKEETAAAIRLEGFRGVSVPVSREDAMDRLSVRRPAEPQGLPDDGGMILDELLRVGVLRPLDDDRIDVPDIFRYAFEIGPDYATAWRDFIEGKGREQAAIDQFLREAPLLQEILRRVAEDTKIVEQDLERGDWAGARAKLEQQVKLWEAAQDLENQVDTRMTLAMVDTNAANLPAAQAQLESALQLARKLRDTKRQARVWLMLSGIHFVRGDGEKTEDALRRAADLIDRKKLVELEAGFWSQVSFLNLLAGSGERAAELARKALESLRRSGDESGVPNLFLATGTLLLGRHDMNGLLLICLAEAASRVIRDADNRAIVAFLRGYEEGAGVPFDGPQVELLRDHAGAEWQKDRGDSLLDEVLKAAPNTVVDRILGKTPETSVVADQRIQ